MKPLIVFDFDGVLADSFEAVYAINKLALAHVGKVLKREKFRKMFFKNIHVSFNEFIVDRKKIKQFRDYKYNIFSSLYNKEKVKLYPFTPSLIKYFHQIADLCIVSSAPEKEIRELLKAFRLDVYFKTIEGTNRKGKRYIFGQYEKKYKDIYFITDTVGDIKEVKNFSVRVIAVTWGFHSKDLLSKENPEFVADDVEDIFLIIKK